MGQKKKGKASRRSRMKGNRVQEVSGQSMERNIPSLASDKTKSPDKGSGSPGREVQSDDTQIVKFVYSEKTLLYHQVVNPSSSIPGTFLKDSMVFCVEKWKSVLPDLRVTDLHARASPLLPMNGTFRDWDELDPSGLVHVELDEGSRHKGLFSQLAALERKQIECELVMEAKLEKALERKQIECELVMEAKLEKAMSSVNKKVSDSVKGYEKKFRKVAAEVAMLNRQKAEKEEANKILIRDRVRAEELYAKAKHELDLSIASSSSLMHNHTYLLVEVERLRSFRDHIHRRGALDRARTNINRVLEKRDLRAWEKWSAFYQEFSVEDWNKIFGNEGHRLVEDVKTLLKKGSLDTNRMVHGTEASEARDSILELDDEEKKAAWLWVFSWWSV